eukprot:g8080.t1
MIPDPLSASIAVIKAIAERVQEAKINQDGCKLLGELAAQTLPILEALDPTTLDRTAQMGVEDVKNALDYASMVVERCCTTNIFSAIIHNQDHGLMLKRAADDLAHALQQMPLANLTTTADIAAGVSEIAEKLKNSEFREKAAVREQTEKLKKELEKAFFNSTEENEGVKDLIDSLVGMHEFTKEELDNKLLLDLDSLKFEAENAKNSKEKQLEFEFEQVIKVISGTIGVPYEAKQPEPDLKQKLSCPISKEIMRDPVTIIETGNAYERTNIDDWFKKGNRSDPKTQKDLKSTKYIANRTLQFACLTYLRDVEGEKIDMSKIRRNSLILKLEPGMREGHCTFTINNVIVHASQTIILEPNGSVLGLTFYKSDNDDTQKTVLEIGGGEWNTKTGRMNYGDMRFSYQGDVEVRIHYRQPIMEYIGKVASLQDIDNEVDFEFMYALPPPAHQIFPRLGIWQIEGGLVVEYKEGDSQIDSEEEYEKARAKEKEEKEEAEKAKAEAEAAAAAEAAAKVEGEAKIEEVEGDAKVEVEGEAKVVEEEGETKVVEEEGETKVVEEGDVKVEEEEGETKVVEEEGETKVVEEGDVKVEEQGEVKVEEEGETKVKEEGEVEVEKEEGKAKVEEGEGKDEKEASEDEDEVDNRLLLDDQYSCSLVLSLETDSSINGWMWLKAAPKDPPLLARVLNGEWKSEGTLAIYAYFPPKGVPLNSDTKPTNVVGLYRVEGKITHDHTFFRSGFKSKIIEQEVTGMEENDNSYLEFLQGTHKIKFSSIREASTPWHYFHPEPLKLFIVSRNFELEDQGYKMTSTLNFNYASIDNISTVLGRTPLHNAAKYNSVDDIEELISKGEEINAQDDNGETSLYCAAENNSVDAAQVLINKGAQVNIRSKEGWHAIHIAAQKNSSDVVELLIGKNVNVNLKTTHGWSPLHLAASTDSINAVKVLITKGANVDLTTKEKHTPLCLAAKSNAVHVVRELIAKNAKINHQDDNGNAPLHIAIENNSINVIRELLAHDANFDLQRNDGRTPLHVATQNRLVSIVKDLINKGADIDALDNEEWTSLHVAAHANAEEVVKELTTRGANIALETNNGWTALHVASSCGRVSIVRILLKQGASKGSTNDRNQTPFDVICTDQSFSPYREEARLELESLLGN